PHRHADRAPCMWDKKLLGRANYLNSLAGAINTAAVVWESISHQVAFPTKITTDSYLRRRCSWPQKIANGTLTHPPVRSLKASKPDGKTAWALMILNQKPAPRSKLQLPVIRQLITKTTKMMTGAKPHPGRSSENYFSICFFKGLKACLMSLMQAS